MAQYSEKHSLIVKIAFIAILGCVGLTQAVTLEVKDGNSTCIKAELSAALSIQYTVTNGTQTAILPIPDSATVSSSSSCGGDSRTPLLVATFGSTHSLSLSFSSNGSLYRVDNLSLEYNLGDSTVFPGSTTIGLVIVSTASTGILAGINTTYRCVSASPLSLGGGGVTITFSNMRMEAYMPGADLSLNETVCTADQSVTTPSLPTTTTSKSSAPTTAPEPTPPGNPERGNYSVTSSNGTACLLARMGLQLNLTYTSSSQNKTIQQLVNLHPNQTKNTGSCEPARAVLMLMEENTNLSFSFALNSTTSKYHLSGINVSAAWPDMTQPFSGSNTSLEYLRGTLGRSYMCSAEQTLSVVPEFSLNTFQLQVQPFGVTGDQFGAAEECQLDEDNMLIPIIVGAALAGLVLIVLIAYLIGRKRSHAGYQTI
ncbi:lysosome-associated membrane glycoprotein 1a [Megalops cyprinoides]|uniref:lysosome-associated membrane glycoprotein 1a n=1 Tax=Megalops cyprinoides TaxID=118141 RepID=UPI0018651966|nr:lysosome-associated membrane glycoprotein 1a [Megalops cyprinoides]